MKLTAELHSPGQASAEIQTFGSVQAGMGASKLVQGPKGDPGDSAYDQAVQGGYTGTEEEFEAFLASLPQQAAQAAQSAAAAAQSEENAAQSEENAAQSEENAAQSAQDAAGSAQSAEDSLKVAEAAAKIAAGSALNAGTSAQNAAASAAAADSSRQSAEESAESASDSKNSAASYASSAEESAAAAALSAENADKSADDAEQSAALAESALGKGPYIGENGNWYVWNTKTGAFQDTGVPATGLTDQNSGATVKMWFGTITEYNALPVIREDTYYNILEGEV